MSTTKVTIKPKSINQIDTSVLYKEFTQSALLNIPLEILVKLGYYLLSSIKHNAMRVKGKIETGFLNYSESQIKEEYQEIVANLEDLYRSTKNEDETRDFYYALIESGTCSFVNGTSNLKKVMEEYNLSETDIGGIAKFIVKYINEYVVFFDIKRHYVHRDFVIVKM